MPSEHEHKNEILRQTLNVAADGLGFRAIGICVLLVAVVVISATGCRGKSRLQVAPVHGKVTYKGQGVPRATVILSPVGETSDTVKRLRPFGYSDDQGDFELKTYVSGDGAPPGKYRVGIVAQSSAVPTKRGKEDPATMPVSTAPSVNIPADVITKYGNPDTSGIEITVVDGENNLPPFTL